MVLFKNMEDLLQGVIDGTIQVEKFKELGDVYEEAYTVSKEYGYVGVGCISWAERALQEYQGMQTKAIPTPVLFTDEDFT